MCRVGGGCEDGSVVCWDTRTGLSLVAGEQHAEAVWGAVRRIPYLQCLNYISTISALHIYNICTVYLQYLPKVWTSSKTGTEMITAGGDGVVKFWDVRQARGCDNRSRYSLSCYVTECSPDARTVS